jgi:hypothetical protein
MAFCCRLGTLIIKNWIELLILLSLCSSDQRSWLQIQSSGFDSRHYQIFWEVVGLERGQLSPVSKTEELLEIKSSGSGLEKLDYVRRGSTALATRHPSIRKKLALISSASGGRSVWIFRSRTQTTEFSLLMPPRPFLGNLPDLSVSKSYVQSVRLVGWRISP